MKIHQKHFTKFDNLLLKLKKFSVNFLQIKRLFQMCIKNYNSLYKKKHFFGQIDWKWNGEKFIIFLLYYIQPFNIIKLIGSILHLLL